MYKIEVLEENGQWHDIRGADGNLLTFAQESEARTRLETLYPILVKMEKYAGLKRTRVISMWTAKQDEDWKTKPAWPD